MGVTPYEKIMNKPTKILILGNYRQTITIIRSLAKSRYNIVVGHHEKNFFTKFSRYTSEVWIHPEITKNENEFINNLIKYLAEKKEHYFIFPVGEYEILCLERHIDKIASLARIIIPDKETFFTCINKSKIYEIVSSIAIPSPETKIIKNKNELIANSNIIGYPCVIKPNNSFKPFFDKKAIICATPQELEKSFSSWPSGNDILILQKYVTGYRHNCHFFAVKGEILSYFEHRVLRTDSINGAGYGVENVTIKPSALLHKYCVILIQKLRYSGVGCVQFLVDDKSGEAKFLEINPRLDANCALPYRYGYDFIWLAFKYARGCRNFPTNVAAGYPVGKKAYWFLGDITGLANEWESGTINRMALLKWIMNIFRAFLSADIHITWWWRDPLPSLFLCCSILFSIPGRIKRMWSKKINSK